MKDVEIIQAYKTSDGQIYSDAAEAKAAQTKINVMEVIGRIVDVMSAPPIDAVPVVRCEECSHKEKHSYYCLLHSIFVRSDFFCKDGQRLIGEGGSKE
jgi:hypothetical protein